MSRRVARLCAVLLALFVIVALIAPAVRADDDDPSEGVHEVVVKLRPSHASIDQINATYGTRTVATLLRSAGIYLLQAPAGHDADELADRMEEDRRLLYAEPNFVQQAPEVDRRFHWSDDAVAVVGPDAALRDNQYAVELLGLPQAHQRTRGEGAVVAVLDTGFELGHPTLAGRLAPEGYDFVDDDADPSEGLNAVDDDGDGEVDEGLGHATHVAGVVLLAAPEARVLPLRVLNSDGTGNVFAAAEAIVHAVAKGAHVVNLSFSAPSHSVLLEEVIKDATASGVVVVAAGGNLGSDLAPNPAGLGEVLAVTATDRAGVKAPFANYGGWVDVAAPGDNIVSAFPGGVYAEWDGTSMATPFVAGQAALLRGGTGLDGKAVTDMITKTARTLDSGVGAGLVDVGASVGMLPVKPLMTCGQVLTQSTVVPHDLRDCPGDGLVVGADGITIDLAGYVVDGVGSGSGIRNDGYDSVTITNGTLEDFDHGVHLGPGTALNQVTQLIVQRNQESGIQLTDADDGANGNQVRDNRVASNGSGIALVQGTEHAVVEANHVSGSGKVGIRLELASVNRVAANSVDASEDAGMAVVASSNSNRIEGNSVSRSGGAGIAVVDATGSELIGNGVHYSGDSGIVLDRARDGLTRRNDVRFNPGGIALIGAAGNRLEENDASQTTGTGIALDAGSIMNLLVANTANDNSGRGVAVEAEAPAGSGNVLDRNTANGNSGGGIYVAKTGHAVTANRAEANSGWGIYAAPGTVDGGANLAGGNSEPRQCFKIECSG
jgi:parallel beta-helix repeat protein